MVTGPLKLVSVGPKWSLVRVYLHMQPLAYTSAPASHLKRRKSPRRPPQFPIRSRAREERVRERVRKRVRERASEGERASERAGGSGATVGKRG